MYELFSFKSCWRWKFVAKIIGFISPFFVSLKLLIYDSFLAISSILFLDKKNNSTLNVSFFPTEEIKVYNWRFTLIYSFWIGKYSYNKILFLIPFKDNLIDLP